MINKTENITFPLSAPFSDKPLNIGRQAMDEMVRKWHQCVEEFCRSVGIDESNAHEVCLVQSEKSGGLETDTSITRNGVILGTVSTALKNTPAGLKFTITCQQVPSGCPPSPAEDDGVPHEIDYDRGDGTFITAAL